jgi:transcriptional regulator with XRE-family HTH domain
MPARSEPYDAPAIVTFAIELEHWRTEAGLSKRKLAESLGYTEQYVGQVELCKNLPGPDFAEALDTFFDAKGLFMRLWKRIDDTRHAVVLPPGFPRFVKLEAGASVIRVYGLLLITGLLQTEEYAREVLLTVQQPSGVDQLLATRTERQQILAREEPPRLFVTLDERSLRSGIGGPEIMRAQLAHLLKVSQTSDVTIDVVPERAGANAGFEGSFTILSFEDGPDMAYTEAAGRGQVIEDAPGVADFHVRYDLIRGHALPVPESRKLIKSIMESYEQA